MKNQVTKSTFTASHEDISARARQLWESYGQPSDRDNEIWLEAERQLLGADPIVEVKNGESVSAAQFDEATAQGKTRTRVEKAKAPAAKPGTKKIAAAKR